MEKVIKNYFELILTILILFRIFLESMATYNGLPDFNTVFRIFTFFINIYFFVFIFLNKYTVIENLKLKKYAVYLFIIPIFVGFFLNFTTNNRLEFYYVDSFIEFLTGFLTFTLLSNMHILLKIEAMILLPVIFFTLCRNNIGIRKGLFYTFIIYTYIFLSGCIQYISIYSKIHIEYIMFFNTFILFLFYRKNNLSTDRLLFSVVFILFTIQKFI